MRVAKINWLNEDIGEAEIVISDGQYEVLCFAYPLYLSEGDIVEQPLLPFEEHVMLSFNRNFSIEKGGGSYFEYINIIGEVIGVKGEWFDKTGFVRVGGLLFELGPFPPDIEVGEFVTFSCERINVCSNKISNL